MAARPGHQRDVIVSGPPDTRFDVLGSGAQSDTGWQHARIEVILSRAGSAKPRVSGAKQRTAKTSPERPPVRPSAPPGLARSRPCQGRHGRSPSRSDQQSSTPAQCLTTSQISSGPGGKAHADTARLIVAVTTATTIADSPFVTARAYRRAGEGTCNCRAVRSPARSRSGRGTIPRRWLLRGEIGRSSPPEKRPRCGASREKVLERSKRPGCPGGSMSSSCDGSRPRRSEAAVACGKTVTGVGFDGKTGPSRRWRRVVDPREPEPSFPVRRSASPARTESRRGACGCPDERPHRRMCSGGAL
jgi:hypothetical protein